VARPRALVVGGSLAGLFAANLLRSTGWEVAVFERAAGDLSGRGAGLGTREELFAVLRRIGIGLDQSIGVQVLSRLGLDCQGRPFCEVPIRSVTTAWDLVYRALRKALPAGCYHPAMRLERLEAGMQASIAVFSDGSRAEADLVVGADGIHSTVRSQFLPHVRPRYAGYVSWRGVAMEDDIPPAFRETVAKHMNFCFPDGELALSVPMPAGRSQFSWFRPVEYPGGLRQICTDASGRCHGDSIAPPLMRREVLAGLQVSAAALLAPQIAALVAAAPQLILQPIFDLESPGMAFGRAVLVGDAAFVARPHVGTGVTKAALDAQCLADALHAAGGDVDAALERFERERLPAGRDLVARGRYLGSYLEGRANRDRDPAQVMREFGSAGIIAR
jgi:2-polyprenyl-6-methoxyphenol hydroxylase-like FAD-dependent oxidoreductase